MSMFGFAMAQVLHFGHALARSSTQLIVGIGVLSLLEMGRAGYFQTRLRLNDQVATLPNDTAVLRNGQGV